jgi:hypothetical protein
MNKWFVYTIFILAALVNILSLFYVCWPNTPKIIHARVVYQDNATIQAVFEPPVNLEAGQQYTVIFDGFKNP